VGGRSGGSTKYKAGERGGVGIGVHMVQLLKLVLHCVIKVEPGPRCNLKLSGTGNVDALDGKMENDVLSGDGGLEDVVEMGGEWEQDGLEGRVGATKDEATAAWDLGELLEGLDRPDVAGDPSTGDGEHLGDGHGSGNNCNADVVNDGHVMAVEDELSGITFPGLKRVDAGGVRNLAVLLRRKVVVLLDGDDFTMELGVTIGAGGVGDCFGEGVDGHDG